MKTKEKKKKQWKFQKKMMTFQGFQVFRDYKSLFDVSSVEYQIMDFLVQLNIGIMVMRIMYLLMKWTGLYLTKKKKSGEDEVKKKCHAF